MTRSHVEVLILASLALGGGVIACLCVLPDGTRHTFPRQEHVFVSLGVCLVGGLGIYAAVVLPVILHALRSRWPFRIFVVVSGLFGLLNLSLIFSGLYSAGEDSSGTQQVLDILGGLFLGVGVFLLYLLVGVCFTSWAVWQRVRSEPTTTDR